ncbi:hypothetical protein Zmor_002923 [Zophobas morio]|uniref:Uncharacterized protein n=1 Tax=Zophobas morio TaxID=2755281 RepID=A0AA38HN64_9CUCU|nr:hypothetical protein Zmor_002923 [Zophobas morio]
MESDSIFHYLSYFLFIVPQYFADFHHAYAKFYECEKSVAKLAVVYGKIPELCYVMRNANYHGIARASECIRQLN